MNSFKVGELVIIGVNACAKEEPCISPIDNLVVAELDEVGLVFLVARCYKAMNLCNTRLV